MGTLHLLLGLLEEPEGIATWMLLRLRIEPLQVRWMGLEMVRAGEFQYNNTW
ncbi:Clp protease N-terminal domain-containing protein [Rubrobacter aplysinae]|uniref:Clp protease N-terminal domain-containing protein n=1 Tax=Rubrobacter aplysinae TaxID=909625 RepID=UPI00389A7F6D